MRAATEFRVWSGCSQGNHRRRYSAGGFFVQWAGNYGTGEFGNGLNGGFPAIDHCSIIQYNSLFTVIHMSITVATVPRPVRKALSDGFVAVLGDDLAQPVQIGLGRGGQARALVGDSSRPSSSRPESSGTVTIFSLLRSPLSMPVHTV